MLSIFIVLSIFLPCRVVGTGHPSARADVSRAHLLNQIASSTPYHIRGTPQEEFDCAWRALAYEWVPDLQPWLNATQRRQLHNALELDACPPPARVNEPSSSSNDGPSQKRPSPADPAAVYVSASSGSDEGAGTIEKPFATISRAVLAVRKQSHRPSNGNGTIYLREGTYYLASPVELDSRDSGLTISAFNDEHVVISGGVHLTGLDWQPSSTAVASGGGAVYVADLSSFTLPR